MEKKTTKIRNLKVEVESVRLITHTNLKTWQK